MGEVSSTPIDKSSQSSVPKPLVETITYSNAAHHFSFDYPKTWNQVPFTPPNDDGMTFGKYPFSGNEQIEIHMTVGEKLDLANVVQSDAVEHKKETVLIAGMPVQKLSFEQRVSHGGYFYMREIHVAVPLPSGKFLNLLGVCQMNVDTAGRCSKAIDEVMNDIVIPSVRIASSASTARPGNKNTVDSFSNQPTTAGLNLVRGEKVDNQGCNGSGPVMFGTSPMDPKDIGMILPYGGMIGAHVTPIDHMYFSPIVFHSPRDTYEVRAMADGLITAISERTQNVSDTNNGSPKLAEYLLKFWYTCDFASYYDLITSLSPRLKAEFDAKKQNGGYANVQIKVREGEIVGRIGGQTLDFAVYDYTKILPGFIVPEHYLGESWKTHVVNPFPYFKEPVRSQLLALNPRQTEPREGKIDYDQDGKLVGTWFKGGHNGFGNTGENPSPWRAHLSFAYDYVDPTALVISIGDYGGLSQQFGVKMNTPDPATITPSSGTVTYELANIEYNRSSTGAHWDRMHVYTDIKARPQSQVQGIALVQMLENRKIKFEAFPGKTREEVSGFTAKAILYER